MRKTHLAILGAVALLAALALPAAANDVLYSGIDIWQTPADGSTFFDFSREPLPAGFFCGKSAPFTGKILFRGVPIVTEDGSLGGTDTIVERLDDVVLDAKGTGMTRVQLRALQFESIAPVKTACGKFNVRVRLDDGEQPITRMRIVKENENGGRFFATIGVRARVSFTPVRGNARRPMEVVREVRFEPSPVAYWSLAGPEKALRQDLVQVDSNADGQPDVSLPGTSNFVAGSTMNKTCHYDPGCGGHCQVLYPTLRDDGTMK